MSSFYTEEELRALGLKYCGEGVLISRKASIYGASNMEIGSHSRVDDFAILSGKIRIGCFSHVAAHTTLVAGNAGITIGNWSGFSSHCSVYAVSDDYSGRSLMGPMTPEKYKKMTEAPVVLEDHTGLGVGSAILPGVTMRQGSMLGAMSLLTKTTEPWTIYFGSPAKPVKPRRKKVLELEEELWKEFGGKEKHELKT